MRDVVIIGGGLSGLSAAYALEQQAIDYTLIEVQRRIGGSIQSVRQDGFTMDYGSFALADTFDDAWLDGLGLADALIPIERGKVAFKEGTEALITALEQHLVAPRLLRMAVSSIGELDDGRFSICMENGLVLDARSLIVALPARYAERIFYGYKSALTEALLRYRYDTIQRLSLGFRSAELPARLPTPGNMAHVFKHITTHPQRVPAGHTLIQFGLRLAPNETHTRDQMIAFLRHTFGLPAPVSHAVGYWPQADPISCYDDDHAAWVQSLRDQLPPGIALINSDFSSTPPSRQGIADLQVRIQQGQQAAQQMLAFLNG